MSVKLYDNLPLNQGVVLDIPNIEGTGALVCDLSKYHNNGVFGAGAAAPTWTQLPSGIWVTTYIGTGQDIICPAAASINNLPQLSWETWIYSVAANVDRFLDKNQKGFRILASNLFALFYAATTNAQSRESGVFPLNTLVHTVLTYDDTGDRKIYLYKNGIEVTYDYQTAAVGALNNDAANTFKIGTEPGFVNYMNGYIGQVRVYARALSAAEVAARFQETRGHYGV